MADLKATLIDIAKAIVDSPDEVAVVQTEDENSITLVLSVAPDDMGMVIGKHGKIAKAIRSLIKAAAGNNGKKVNVEIKSGVHPLDAIGNTLHIQIFIIECTTNSLKHEIIPLGFKHQWFDGDALGQIHPLGEVNGLILVEVISPEDAHLFCCIVIGEI